MSFSSEPNLSALTNRVQAARLGVLYQVEEASCLKDFILVQEISEIISQAMLQP